MSVSVDSKPILNLNAQFDLTFFIVIPAKAGEVLLGESSSSFGDGSPDQVRG